MTDEHYVEYLAGEYGDCLAYAEACNLEGGEWEHVASAAHLRSVPAGAELSLICTDEAYWSLKGYWHGEEFSDVVWDRDIWIQRINMAEA